MIKSGDRLIFPDGRGPSVEGFCLEVSNAGIAIEFPTLGKQNWTPQALQTAIDENLCYIAKGTPHV